MAAWRQKCGAERPKAALVFMTSRDDVTPQRSRSTFPQRRMRTARLPRLSLPPLPRPRGSTSGGRRLPRPGSGPAAFLLLLLREAARLGVVCGLRRRFRQRPGGGGPPAPGSRGAAPGGCEERWGRGPAGGGRAREVSEAAARPAGENATPG